MPKIKKLKIALLLGGTSPEREISKSSGASVYKALIESGYETIVIDPAYGKQQPDDVQKFFTNEDHAPISNRNYIEALNLAIFDDVDLVFLILHGRWGEDGTVQSLLELRGIKYTGSKVLSSAIAIDKHLSKTLFRNSGVRTADWFIVHKSGYNINEVAREINAVLNYPVVIKPNDQGSTVGLTICKNENEIEAAINLAHEFSSKAMVEGYISGRELTVGIIGQQALPVLEIKPKSGLYDFESKYTPGMSEYVVPAKIPENVFKELQRQALFAFNALQCEGFARVDFRLNENNESYCLEVNTLPGMTSLSLVPKMAAEVGISFNELIEKIIELSL